MTQSDIKLDREKDNVFVVQEHPNMISVVYPRLSTPGACERRSSPGVVVLTMRMSKRRCKTCSGRDGCIHGSIYDLALVTDMENKFNYANNFLQNQCIILKFRKQM